MASPSLFPEISAYCQTKNKPDHTADKPAEITVTGLTAEKRTNTKNNEKDHSVGNCSHIFPQSLLESFPPMVYPHLALIIFQTTLHIKSGRKQCTLFKVPFVPFLLHSVRQSSLKGISGEQIR